MSFILCKYLKCTRKDDTSLSFKLISKRFVIFLSISVLNKVQTRISLKGEVKNFFLNKAY